MSSKSIHIGEGSIIEAPTRPLLGYQRSVNKQTSVFGENVWIGAHCIIGKGVRFGNNVIISDGSHVEERVKIGNGTLLTYRCLIGSDSSIGEKCVIGGFVGENTTIGNGCRIFGSVLHHHVDPTKEWDAPSSMEEGATLASMVFMGFGARITKPVEISNNVYIFPNSIVSVNVPPFHIVRGINDVIPAKNLKGELSRSPFFYVGQN